MAARTVSAQLGYMIGAVVGGVVLAVAGSGRSGWVLFAGMAYLARCWSPASAIRPSKEYAPQLERCSAVWTAARVLRLRAEPKVRRATACKKGDGWMIRRLSVVAAARCRAGRHGRARVGSG